MPRPSAKRKGPAPAAVEAPRSSRVSREFVAAAAVFAVTLAVYVRTLWPTFAGGDSSELIVAVHVLGVPHPTGYPLFLLLSKLLETLLPIGSVAYRLNLVSALYGAAAAGTLAWVGARITRNLWCGLAAGLFLSLERGLWGQSTELEVYSLNALFLGLLLVALVKWEDDPTPRRAAVLALVVGLGLAHHRSIAFFCVPAWLWCWWRTPGRDLRLTGKMIAGALAPSLLYLLLIPLAMRHPAVNWGGVQLGWRYWYWHVTARQFTDLLFTLPPGDVLQTARGHWVGLMREYGPFLTSIPFVPVLAAVGVIGVMRGGLRVTTACGFLLTLPVTYSELTPDRLVWAILAIGALALWAAVGLGAAGRWLARRSGGARWAAIVAPAFAAGVVAHLVAVNWRDMDMSNRWENYNATRSTLQAMPRGALLMTDGNIMHNGAYPYLQVIEGRRRDVTVAQVGLVREQLTLWNTRDSALRSALEKAYREARAIPGRAVRKDIKSFWAVLLDALRKAGEKRRIFAQIPADISALPEKYVWKDYGDCRELVDGWPELEERYCDDLPAGTGVGLVSAAVEPTVAKPGDMVRVTLRWQVGEELDHAPSLLVMFGRVSPDRQELGEWFGDRIPLVYGKTPLAANRPGYVYRQEKLLMAPANAVAGEYVLALVRDKQSRPLTPGVRIRVIR